MGVKVTVQGDLRSALAAKAAAVRRGGTRAVAEETHSIAADMRRRASVGDSKRGRRGKPPLKQSIESRTADLRGEARVKAKHVVIFEHGTKNRPAKPIVRPAAETARRRFPKRVATEVRKELS